MPKVERMPSPLYQAVGNREDLSNVIYNIDPFDTPVMERDSAAAMSRIDCSIGRQNSRSNVYSLLSFQPRARWIRRRMPSLKALRSRQSPRSRRFARIT